MALFEDDIANAMKNPEFRLGWDEAGGELAVAFPFELRVENSNGIFIAKNPGEPIYSEQDASANTASRTQSSVQNLVEYVVVGHG